MIIILIKKISLLCFNYHKGKLKKICCNEQKKHFHNDVRRFYADIFDSCVELQKLKKMNNKKQSKGFF